MIMSQTGMCYQIKHSVGLNGKNEPADVQIVQNLLMKNGNLPLRAMTYDRPTMVAAIKEFQSGFMLNPDGNVDPKGTTFERLQGLGLVEMAADGGKGWYRYETGDLHKSRIMHFGTANAVQAVLDVAGTVAFGLPGFAIGVGDLSSAMGTNLGRHQTHLHGKNVDVHPSAKIAPGSPPISMTRITAERTLCCWWTPYWRTGTWTRSCSTTPRSSRRGSRGCNPARATTTICISS